MMLPFFQFGLLVKKVKMAAVTQVFLETDLICEIFTQKKQCSVFT